jgi:hypothetical protein
MFTVVRTVDAHADFARWRADPAFAVVEAHPVYGAFGRHYYPAVFQTGRVEESFAILDGSQPVGLISCSAGSGELDYFGFPIRFFGRDGGTDWSSKALDLAFGHLEKLAKQHRTARVTVADDAALGILSAIGRQCLNRRAHGVLRLTGLNELRGGEAEMKRDVRKSYHSLINWGGRNLQTSIVGVANPDREMFARYQEFHRAVAGRVTRPQESWDAMFDWIAKGRGELILGFLNDGELVTGTLVVDGTTTSFYASGVYDRDRFELPLAHWPLWQAMVRSAERGMRVFDLGDLPMADAATAKEVSIGYFKRGFATNIATWIAWSWSPAVEVPAT